MAKEILKCQICNKYTLKKTHCKKPTKTTKPAKYSPEDKYGKYRRQYKEKELKNDLENK